MTTTCARQRRRGCIARTFSGRRGQARGGASGARRARASLAANGFPRPPPARAGRKRELGADRDACCDPDRAREKIDAVITTSPPGSVHMIGAAVKRATGARWVADLRDSLVSHPHRRADSRATRLKEQSSQMVARLVARSADAIVCVSDAIAEETRALRPAGKVVTIPNGCDFDDFAGLPYRPSERFRITHTGSFFGQRSPRPFLSALAESGLDVVARFVGDFRAADREWAEQLELGDRLELQPFTTRHRALELQRDSEALLLLIPDAGGRGQAASCPERCSSISLRSGRSWPPYRLTARRPAAGRERRRSRRRARRRGRDPTRARRARVAPPLGDSGRPCSQLSSGVACPVTRASRTGRAPGGSR